MPKKCILCEDNASHAVKGTNNYYCRDCATEQFGDLTLLQPISGPRQAAKNLIADRLGHEQGGETGGQD